MLFVHKAIAQTGPETGIVERGVDVEQERRTLSFTFDSADAPFLTIDQADAGRHLA